VPTAAVKVATEEAKSAWLAAWLLPKRRLATVPTGPPMPMRLLNSGSTVTLAIPCSALLMTFESAYCSRPRATRSTPPRCRMPSTASAREIEIPLSSGSEKRCRA
jgi:hypothetical protein